MGDARSDDESTRRIMDHVRDLENRWNKELRVVEDDMDGELRAVRVVEDDLNSELSLRAVEDFVEGVLSSGDDTTMEVDGQLGFQPEENVMEGNCQLGFQPEVNVMEGNGQFRFLPEENVMEGNYQLGFQPEVNVMEGNGQFRFLHEKNAMEGNGQLGFQPEVNVMDGNGQFRFQPGVNVMEGNGQFRFQHEENVMESNGQLGFQPEVNVMEGNGQFGFQHEVNVMEGNSQLGFQPEVNFGAGNAIQYEENIVPSPLPVHQYSTQDSLEFWAPINNVMNTTSPPEDRVSDLFMAVSVSADTNKIKIQDLAYAGLEELLKMALMGEPLWKRKGYGPYQTETLNEVAYNFEFSGTADSHEHRPILNREVSRHFGLVNMTSAGIVELLMDVNKWLVTFSNMVSKATFLGVISTGAGGSYDGALQVLRAEFHLPTALVPARECYFARYSKLLAPMVWGVVDIPLEDLFQRPFVNFRRRPSGCIIQDAPNGCSEVTWVEHGTLHGPDHINIYQHLVVTGFAYGPKRWVSSLIRHCQWLGALRGETYATNEGVMIPQSGRDNCLKLTEKIRRTFWADTCADTRNIWMPLAGAPDIIRVLTKGTMHLPGHAFGTRIVFTASQWFPVPPRTIFDFLRTDISRTKWDIRITGKLMRELAYIIHGVLPENRVSIMQVISQQEETEMMYLQESFYDHTGAYVIYAPFDATSMSRILNGGNTDDMSILPSGFAILPDRPPVFTDGSGDCGSLLTMAFHTIDKASPQGSVVPESLNNIGSIIKTTAGLIRGALVPNRAHPGRV